MPDFGGYRPSCPAGLVWRRLYERHGFSLTQEQTIDQWQGGVREQRFERPAMVSVA